MSFLTALIPPPWSLLLNRYVMYGLLIASALGFVWVKGDQHGTEKLTEYQAQEAIATVKFAQAAALIVHQVEVRYIDRIQTIHATAAQNKGEIYALIGPDRPVSNGFVRLLDAAARNQFAGPAADTDAENSTITASQVASADIETRDIANTCRAQVDGWREFYGALQARVNGRAGDWAR